MILFVDTQFDGFCCYRLVFSRRELFFSSISEVLVNCVDVFHVDLSFTIHGIGLYSEEFPVCDLRLYQSRWMIRCSCNDLVFQ